MGLKPFTQNQKTSAWIQKLHTKGFEIAGTKPKKN
jgi:hypothetical protein